MPRSAPLSNHTEQNIQGQAASQSREELQQILLQRWLDFDLSFRNLYPDGFAAGPGPAMKEHNDLEQRYYEAGGTRKALSDALRARQEAEKHQYRERYRNLIAAGKFPAVPPCPQYYQDDAGCNWELDWFDLHVRKELAKSNTPFGA